MFKVLSISCIKDSISLQNLSSKYPIETTNKYGVLNNSVHDDSSPDKDVHQIKELLYLGKESTSIVEVEENRQKMIGKLKNPDKAKMHYRSKSTSPKRVGSNAKQKEVFKNFNPDKAEWIKK